MTVTGTLTAAGYMWCMVEKTGTAPAKKTRRLYNRRLANASNTTNATTNATATNATNATNGTN